MAWKKIPKMPHYLQVREGKLLTSYRVRYRQHGIKIEQVLEGEFKTPRDALKSADELIYKTRFGEAKKKTSLVRSDDLCDEIVSLKAGGSKANLQLTEIFMRIHLKPFLNGVCAYSDGSLCQFRTYLENGMCPYAADLNVTHYLAYKTHLRLHRPKASLFNHWKYWVMLVRHAFVKGVLTKPILLPFDEEKEDFRKKGQLIADEIFRAILAAATDTWRRRSIVQRLCGQRPGLVRELRKNQIDLDTGLTSVTNTPEKADSKNRRNYQFYMPERALVELRQQALKWPDSPYFFPMETDHSRPMDKHLSGWHSAIETARVTLVADGKQHIAALFPPADNPFTPHDLRHTRLTELAKTPGINHAVTCYQHDLSLEEWMETYAHFQATDTLPIRDNADAKAKELLG